MIYNIINPSDRVSFEANDLRIAQVACLLLGEGQYGLRNEEGEEVLPILVFGGASEWLFENGFIEDPNDHQGLNAFVEANKEALAAVLETTIVADTPAAREKAKEFALQGDYLQGLQQWNDAKRSSMNDIAGRAFALARHFRGEPEPPRASRVVFVR